MVTIKLIMLRLLLPALVVKAVSTCGSTQCPTEARSLLSVKLAASKSPFSTQLLESRLGKKHSLELSRFLRRRPTQGNHTHTHIGTDAGADCFPAVFIVASGRSGSTSLLDMLNVIPGYDLKGENGGSWNLLYNLFSELQELRANSSQEESGNPAWLGINEEINLDELLRGFQALVLGELNPKPGARVTGFKEIRWDFDHKLADVELLLQAFPCGRVVLNYRMDTEYQAVDAMEVFGFSDSEDDAVKDLFGQENRALVEFHSRFPDRSFMLPVENYTVEAFNDLLHWLGEDEKCRYVEVAHSNDKFGSQAAATDSHYINCD